MEIAESNPSVCQRLPCVSLRLTKHPNYGVFAFLYALFNISMDSFIFPSSKSFLALSSISLFI